MIYIYKEIHLKFKIMPSKSFYLFILKKLFIEKIMRNLIFLTLVMYTLADYKAELVDPKAM